MGIFHFHNSHENSFQVFINLNEYSDFSQKFGHKFGKLKKDAFLLGYQFRCLDFMGRPGHLKAITLAGRDARRRQPPIVAKRSIIKRIIVLGNQSI